MQKQLITLSLILPIPFLMFLVYGSLRIMSIQPDSETGMSEFMSTVFFWSGGTVCYFMMCIFGAFRNKAEYLKWLAASSFMVWLAIDETFMIQEMLSAVFGLNENQIFAIYGLVLIAVLLLFRPLTNYFWLAFFGFVFFVGISQTADTLWGEGVITIANRQIDYEQIFEGLGSLCLTFAFSFQAFNSLIQAGLLSSPRPESQSA